MSRRMFLELSQDSHFIFFNAIASITDHDLFDSRSYFIVSQNH